MAEYPEDRPAKGPGSGRRSRRSANARRRAIDAQSVEAPSGRPYGERKETEDAQRAIPLPAAAASQRADLAAALAAAGASAPPGDPISAPTTRPGEPVTAGLPGGAGPGPEALGPGGPGGVGGVTDAELIRALYRRHPTEAMRRLVERMDRASGLDRAMIPGQQAPPPGPGTSAGVQAGFQGMAPGGRTGRIAAREGLQAASGSPDTTEG